MGRRKHLTVEQIMRLWLMYAKIQRAHVLIDQAADGALIVCVTTWQDGERLREVLSAPWAFIGGKYFTVEWSTISIRGDGEPSFLDFSLQPDSRLETPIWEAARRARQMRLEI